MSHFVATSDIPFGGPGRNVFAFRKGEAVPAELVKQHGWEDLVATSGTKAAQTATATQEAK